jgi:hypothetical protein
MEQNKTYIIRIDMGNGKLFTYTGKIISQDDLFVTFVDNYSGKTFSYNKGKILSFEEVRE